MLEDPHVQKTYNIWVIPGVWAIGSYSLPQKTHKSHLLTYFSTDFYGFAPLEL